MKPLTRVTLSILLLALVLPLPVLADRTEAEGNLRRLLDRMRSQIDVVLADGGEGGSWWVWNVSPGRYYQVDRTFYRGNTYVLAATGDSRVSDVDIKVYDENWNVIDSDEDSSNVALVSFTPSWTGVFHVRTINYSGQGTGSIGFVIAFRR